jgi:hypothetical protein
MATEAFLEEKSESPPGGICGSIGMERERILTLMSGVIETLEAKIQRGRIRDRTNEKLRLEAMRVLFYGMSVYNAILKDKEIEEIEKRLEVLEHANEEHRTED